MVGASPIHTRGMASGPAKPERKGSGGSGEHGSVLAEFIGREKEPKQLTAAGKGQLLLDCVDLGWGGVGVGLGWGGLGWDGEAFGVGTVRLGLGR